MACVVKSTNDLRSSYLENRSHYVQILLYKNGGVSMVYVHWFYKVASSSRICFESYFIFIIS